MEKLKLGGSSNILNVWFDAGKETIKVEFVNHRKYLYFFVSQEMVDDWLKAYSVGEWFEKNIRKNGDIKYRRID